MTDSLPATLDDLDDPVSTSDRAPLTGNITNQQSQANARAANSAQGYLNNAIAGEDRRAPLDTLDESVWDTLRRDLLAVWEKMRQVLYPKYLLGGVMARGEGMNSNNAEGGPAGVAGHIRGLVGRWPQVDADTILEQGGMSEGLRDWDLWYAALLRLHAEERANSVHRGPLLFCLLLSFFLSLGAREDQRSAVFSGVFALIWIGEAVVTLQIKLLGGNMYVRRFPAIGRNANMGQFLLPICLHHRLYTLPHGHRFDPQRLPRSHNSTNTRLQRAWTVVISGWREHSGRQWCHQEQSGIGCISTLCFLRWRGLLVLHLIAQTQRSLCNSLNEMRCSLSRPSRRWSS